MELSGSGVPPFGAPRPARLYDYLSGGYDNSRADREVAVRLIQGYPGLAGLIRVNRAFILKAVGWLASGGVGQFVDVGCGTPLHPSVHETARAVDPAVRVAYIDVDPQVVLHMAAHAGGDGLAAAWGDAADPDAVLGDPAVQKIIDLGRPAGVLLGGTLSALDPAAAEKAVAGFARLLAAGSAVVVSCITYADPVLSARQAAVFAEATGAVWYDHGPGVVGGWLEGAGLYLAGGPAGDVRRWLSPVLAGQPAGAGVVGGVGIAP